MPAVIRRCTCKGTPATEFQDRTYGKGRRVCNVRDKNRELVCTCCGKTMK
jgi:hypothetical protein